MLARLTSLSLGKSGIHISLIELMQELINKEVYPLIFAHGGVGASGDLVQLAHLALVLIGEGEVYYQGERRPTAEVFAALNLQPIEMKIREGLALINGTSVMTGIGIVNSYNAQKLLDWSIQASCFINELVQAYDDHFSEELNQAKLHEGQREVAKAMRSYLAESPALKEDKNTFTTVRIPKIYLKIRFRSITPYAVFLRF